MEPYKTGNWQTSPSQKWGDRFMVKWSYDGVDYERIFVVDQDIDFLYEQTNKEVSATFNWNVDGYPVANNTGVWLTFLDGTHAPMMFTTDASGCKFI